MLLSHQWILCVFICHVCLFFEYLHNFNLKEKELCARERERVRKKNCFFAFVVCLSIYVKFIYVDFSVSNINKQRTDCSVFVQANIRQQQRHSKTHVHTTTATNSTATMTVCSLFNHLCGTKASVLLSLIMSIL